MVNCSAARWISQRWELGIVGAIALALAYPSPTNAQSAIVPDDTLGAEQSQVIPNFNGLPIEVITGGARREQNLFHSFEEFNVAEGRGAFFFSPDGLENIFSRVTGNNPSNILGVLGTFGDSAPDLYFMNPNGIIFGSNSRLTVSGSFVATTADGIQFGEQGFFSAMEPELPSQLLTINPSAFLFNQMQPGNIINTSIVPVALNNESGVALGLRVPDGQSLLLLGGNVTLDGSQSQNAGGGGVSAFGGRIELGGLAEPGVVSLNIDNDRLALVFPEGIRRSDLSVIGGSRVDVIGSDGGNIIATAEDINILDSSRLAAGIGQGLGVIGNRSGDIIINATGSLTIANSSDIRNIVPGGIGDAGAISISARDVSLINGGRLASLSLGLGNAGNVTIEATGTISLSGQSDEAGSVILSTIASLDEVGFPDLVGNGDGGDIRLNAGQIFLEDNALIATTTLSDTGNAGNIQINATDFLRLTNSSSIQALTNGQGNAGDIEISASILEVLDGAAIAASTLREGNAGTLLINADSVEVIGSDAEGNGSAILTQASTNSTGDASSLTIDTQRIVVGEGGFISASTFAEGNAGELNVQADVIELTGVNPINSNPSGLFARVGREATGTGGNIRITNVRQLSVREGAEISASTSGRGNAGTLAIDADLIELIGSDTEGVSSAIAAQAELGSTGDANSLVIDAQRLVVREGGQVRVATSGEGDAGELNIQADVIELTGVNPIGSDPSGLFANVGREATGTGGNIRITNVRQLSVREGAEISASTSGRGNAGTLAIDADLIELIGSDTEGVSSAIAAQAELGSTGDANSLVIDAQRLVVREGGQVRVATSGEGDAGELNIQADVIELIGVNPIGSDPSGLFANVDREATGTGGNIRITNVRQLSVRDGANITASTFGEGNAGTLAINADLVEVTGRDTAGNGSAIAAQANSDSTGDANSLIINAQRLVIREGGFVSVQTLGAGDAGNLFINASDIHVIGNESLILARTNSASPAGAIRIRPTLGEQDLAISFQDRATISAETSGSSPGGSIFLRAPNSIFLTGDGSVSTRSTSSGDAGNLRFRTRDLTLTDSIDATVSSLGSGGSGNLTISAQTLRLDNQAQLVAETEAGRGGNIDIQVERTFRIDDNSRISASTQDGQGGQVNITTNDLFLDDRSEISAQSNGIGIAGDIVINAREQLELVDSDIVTAAPEATGGDIFINIAEEANSSFVLLRGDGDITTASGGDGGNITIRGARIIAFDDSDILASSADGQGGNITLDTPAFFGESFTPVSLDADPMTLDGNDRVDINATGNVDGTVALPDVSFIQNSLNDLPESLINTEVLIANSCVVPNADGSSTFVITGAEGLPDRPGEASPSAYPTGDVQSIPDESSESDGSWQVGDPIIEPQGVYQLPNGDLILSHNCQ